MKRLLQMAPPLRLALVFAFVATVVMISIFSLRRSSRLLATAPTLGQFCSSGPLEDWLFSLFSITKLGPFGMMGYQLRLLKSLHQLKPIRHLTELEEGIYRRLGAQLFNWLPMGMTVDSLYQGSSQGKGIVIALGNGCFSMGVHLVRCIRMLGSMLPIYIYYAGPKDLKGENRLFLSGLGDVTLVDITSLIQNDLLKLGSWDVKPFATLLNPFEEVILMDADVVLLEQPEYFFELARYKQSGAIFFQDRHFDGTPGHIEWLDSILPSPLSARVTATAMYHGRTRYQQESGIVVINKGTRFWGLLGACLLNQIKERDVIHSMTHGEKETFWLGFEMADEQYAWAEDQPGLVHPSEPGKPGEEKVICGHIAHFDDKDNLLWFNDGIVVDKRSSKLEAGSFRSMSNQGSWGYCLTTTNLRPIPPHQMEILNRTIGLWEIDPLKNVTAR